MLMRVALVQSQQHAPPPPPARAGVSDNGAAGAVAGVTGGLQEKDAMDYLNEVKRRFTNSPKVSGFGLRGNLAWWGAVKGGRLLKPIRRSSRGGREGGMKEAGRVADEVSEGGR
jgi:hypothetical protein